MRLETRRKWRVVQGSARSEEAIEGTGGWGTQTTNNDSLCIQIWSDSNSTWRVGFISRSPASTCNSHPPPLCSAFVSLHFACTSHCSRCFSFPYICHSRTPTFFSSLSAARAPATRDPQSNLQRSAPNIQQRLLLPIQHQRLRKSGTTERQSGLPDWRRDGQVAKQVCPDAIQTLHRSLPVMPVLRTISSCVTTTSMMFRTASGIWSMPHGIVVLCNSVSVAEAWRPGKKLVMRP